MARRSSSHPPFFWCHAPARNDMLKQMLPILAEGLEKCQKSLESYLEGKRNKFPPPGWDVDGCGPVGGVVRSSPKSWHFFLEEKMGKWCCGLCVPYYFRANPLEMGSICLSDDYHESTISTDFFWRGLGLSLFVMLSICGTQRAIEVSLCFEFSFDNLRLQVLHFCKQNPKHMFGLWRARRWMTLCACFFFFCVYQSIYRI